MADKQQYTQLQFGFDIRTGSPVDRRMVLSIDEMVTGNVAWGINGADVPLANIIPDKYVVLCRGADKVSYKGYEPYFKGKLLVYDADLHSTDVDYYHIPAGGPEYGTFTVVTNVIDIVDSEGLSLTNQEGLVTIYDPNGSRIASAEQRLDVAEADIEDLKVTKVDEDRVADVVDDKLKKYQRRTWLRGSADVFDSEGNPVRAFDSEGKPIYGVHVELTKHDTEPWKEVITHEEVVPKGGWVSKYAVGGVAIGQSFVAGTSIEEVLRQLFEGDPRTDNVVCYNWNSNLPEFWTDIPWRQETHTRKQLHDNKIILEFKPGNQYILMALPRAMLEEYDGDGVKPIKLSAMYHTDSDDNPDFSYSYEEMVIKNSSVADEWGYKVYYLPNKVSGTQRVTFEFKYFDE